MPLVNCSGTGADAAGNAIKVPFSVTADNNVNNINAALLIL